MRGAKWNLFLDIIERLSRRDGTSFIGVRTKFIYKWHLDIKRKTMLESEELKEALNDMTIEDLSAIQAEIRDAKRKRYRSKGKLVHGYVGEKYKDALPIVIDYLYDQKIMERKTIYNLVKLSVEMVVDDVLSKIKQSREPSSTP